MKTIAKLAGVSTMTVSRALRNDPLLRDNTIVRIHEIAERVGYRPDPRIAELMGRLRRHRLDREHDTIAYVRIVDPARPDPVWFTYGRVFDGATHAADQLGYGFEEFEWNIDEIDARRMAGILYARGIRGAILRNDLSDPDLTGFADRLACATIGIPIEDPPLHRSGANLHLALRLAMENLARVGYRRPALYLTSVSDRRTEHLWFCSFIAHQYEAKTLAPELALIAERLDFEEFKTWFETTRPDAIMTNSSEVAEWLGLMGLMIPDPIGFVHLDWTPACGSFAGVDARLEEIGAVAVELVHRQLMHNEVGVPRYPLIAITGGVWVNGESIRQPKPSRTRIMDRSTPASYSPVTRPRSGRAPERTHGRRS